ncbi:hypothetical protein [Marinitenerispora sediminis]|uniref:Secreted protein n=1 Tax=Marinitenerispora sediminis TaxID=1931232 RepID=A0A368SYW5_9ACTN|nr:hypothetical protein [Marinitenerispora sediminis]RCV48600.1 hypothetical protein DEF28_23025 [Marinitenerispora sediminis]RCV49617.1 hypothetical protein DEF24_25075 [Marinitenerispora sediminis]RCV50336.1 hypothetical protein DEF23_22230 [Marinitenerispora sediminis]
MIARSLAVWSVNALLLLASSASCETRSSSGAGTARTSCEDRDCTVTVSGSGGSGDLWERGRSTVEYRVVLGSGSEADVRVTSRDRSQRESGDATVRPGESVELQGYTVRYVEYTADAATFEFIWQE